MVTAVGCGKTKNSSTKKQAAINIPDRTLIQSYLRSLLTNITMPHPIKRTNTPMVHAEQNNRSKKMPCVIQSSPNNKIHFLFYLK